MNEAQKKWSDNKTNRVESVIKLLMPLKDYEWEAISIMIDGIIKESKENSEVRSQLFDMVAKYDKR